MNHTEMPLNQIISYFEAVEIKYGIPISLVLVEDAFDKIQHQQVERYYLLTTPEPNTIETEQINNFTAQVRKHHGCEIIVNGVMPSLKYYMRLLGNPAKLLQRYEENLFTDYEVNTDVKQIHIEKWIELRQQYD